MRGASKPNHSGILGFNRGTLPHVTPVDVKICADINRMENFIYSHDFSKRESVQTSII